MTERADISDSAKLQMVVVSLTNKVATGYNQIPIRIRQTDRNNIHRAAIALGMSAGEFQRTVLANAAKRVLEELGEAFE